MALVLVTPPAGEPVSLTEARAHLRVSADDEDALIAGYILAARQWVERTTQRKLATQTWDWQLDEFSPCLTPPVSPLQSVTSIQYTDPDGALQTLPSSEYQVDTGSLLARIAPAYGKAWPATRAQLHAVTVRLVIGYSTAMPEEFRHAILMLVAHWYENREAIAAPNAGAPVPLGVQSLLSPHRLFVPEVAA